MDETANGVKACEGQVDVFGQVLRYRVSLSGRNDVRFLLGGRKAAGVFLVERQDGCYIDIRLPVRPCTPVLSLYDSRNAPGSSPSDGGSAG